MTLMNRIANSFRNRAAFVRTRDEIAGLPREIAQDLGIFVEDAHIIARRAVYGA
jgi:hypothetical protein